MTLSPHQARPVAAWHTSCWHESRGRCVVVLQCDGAPALTEYQPTMQLALARADALLRQARAGLIQPGTQGRHLSRLADAPLKPAQPQQLDTASLPLFGDGHLQRELF